MTTLDQHLGRRLAAARQLRGLTLEEAASEAFLDADRLALLESGGASPGFDEMRLLCLVYQVPMEDVVGGFEPNVRDRRILDEAAGTNGGNGNGDTAHGAAGTAQSMRTNGHGRFGIGDYTTVLPKTKTTTVEPPRPRSFLRIAAIVLGSVVLIGAVGVGTAVLWPNPPRDVMKTLSYRDAVLILVDSKETATRRELAAARVFGAVIAGVRALATTSLETGDLGNQTNASLVQLRELLESERRFAASDRAAVDRLPGSLLELVNNLKDKEKPAAQRQEAQGPVREGISLGILALKKVDTEPGLSPKLRTHLASYLRKLRKNLASRD